MTQHTKVAFIIEVGGAVSRAQDAEKQTKSTKATADAKRRRRNADFFLHGDKPYSLGSNLRIHPVDFPPLHPRARTTQCSSHTM